MTTGGRRRGRLVGSAGLVAFVLTAACGGPRSTLNTAGSRCFRAIPLARATVNAQGRLVGVRAVTATTLARKLPQAERLGDQRVCLVAFRGPYGSGAVPRADPAGPGDYAIVAVDRSGSTVVASFVVDDLPLRFRHPL
jgi:hypothetical protein